MFKAKLIQDDVIYDALDSIVTREAIQGLQIAKDGSVVFMIEVDPSQGAAMEPMRQKAEEAVRAVKGVKKVTAILTAERADDEPPMPKHNPDPHGMEKNPKLKIAAKKIIAVASGKGGVGKSTIAAGLARQLAADGVSRVGILDADIYGPSQPTLFGIKDFKPDFTEDKRIIPAHVDGIKVMSIGFMVDAEKALVWRGPMVQSAIYQMFRDVEWESIDEDGEAQPLDALIVDMPPGTGDAQLTLAQKVDVTGAVIVSTPQELALADARKAVEMFRAVDVEILGLVENMSSDIFGRGGAKEEAEKLDVPFLGEVPLSADIRINADKGEGFEFPDLTFPL